MKKLKKVLLSLVLFCTLFSFFGNDGLAEDMEPYKYTITLSAGNKGTINGASQVVLTTELEPGKSIPLNVYDLVEVTDEKYYIKGIRLSGRDNAEADLENQNIDGKKGDQDFVVAYGVKGNMVAYTINYQDATGNELSPSNTLYGNLGDKPVVAYRYIENYVPQALAMTKTLSENEGENVFTFVYTSGDAGTITETTTTAVTIVDNTATVPPAGTAGGTTGTTAGDTAAGGTATAGGTAGDTTADAGQTIEDEETPQALVDLDDEETPTSDMKIKDETIAKKAPLAIAIAVVAVALSGLAALLIVLKKGRDNRQ